LFGCTLGEVEVRGAVAELEGCAGAPVLAAAGGDPEDGAGRAGALDRNGLMVVMSVSEAMAGRARVRPAALVCAELATDVLGATVPGGQTSVDRSPLIGSRPRFQPDGNARLTASIRLEGGGS
jgi:hypothetical protein